jgi:biopolymer transport protein TolR
MSEINVTPFVDVMLVLLIIFMVAAPLTVGVPIDLPETQARPMNSDTQPITVSVNDKGQVYLQETEIAVDEVVPRLEAIAKTGYEERIYVRGDKTADYGTVMQVMARISAAGYKNLGLVTLQEQDR